MANEIKGLVNSDGTEREDARTLDTFIPDGGTLTISGGINVIGSVKQETPIKTISSAYTTTPTDEVILLDNGPYTLTLHSAVGSNADELTLNNIGTETIPISGTIQGDSNVELTPNEIINIISNNTNWYLRS